MKKLNAREEQKRLEEPHTKRFCEDFANERRQHRRTVYKRWYAIYLSTVILTALMITLLLVFGMGSGNRHLHESLTEWSFAKNAASFFADLDFPVWKASDKNTDFENPPAADGDDFADTPDGSNGDNTDTEPTDTDVSAGVRDLYYFDYSAVPEGHVAIVPMDISLTQYGESYINNSSGYTPDVQALLNKNLSGSGYVPLSAEIGPKVLIIHTHATEGYCPDGAISVPEGEDDARSTDTEKNMIAVGRVLADTLTENGVSVAHCTVMHDSVQYKDSYARAEETIKKYLEEYPTIKLVIDLHRDSIFKSGGELVRPVAELDGKAAAQLMCVVGTPWEGDTYPNWQNNLSLALKLRRLLNAECENICRPTYLKSHTYNQEIAPYSLLVEVGASGNSLPEAERSAELLGEKIAELLKMI